MKKVLVGSLIGISLLILTGCNMTNNQNNNQTTGSTSSQNSNELVVKSGDNVKVDYVGKLEDGKLFDTSILEEAKKAGTGVYQPARKYEPLAFKVGAGQMIPGFDKGVVGMKVGETKTVKIAPAEAYGEYSGNMVVDIPYSTFSGANITPKVGEVYNFGGGQGKILELSGGNVKVDFNHPLAGKTLIFDITVKQIN